MERATQVADAFDKDCKIIVIADCENSGYKNFDAKKIKAIIGILHKCYIERIFAVHIFPMGII